MHIGIVRRAALALGALVLVSLAAAPLAAEDPCADPAACCVHPDVCLITDLQRVDLVTLDEMVTCPTVLGTYVSGAEGPTGLAPAFYPAIRCGLSYSQTPFVTRVTAANSLDHRWVQSAQQPLVMDLGAPASTVRVFPSVDHLPLPAEAVEFTVWGRDDPDTTDFPTGWTRGTLSTLWVQGWEEPMQCEPGLNADDFVSQWTFPGDAFRYVAVHADYSVTIFDDASHLTWPTVTDNSELIGWQSEDHEVDAVGTPQCAPDDVSAEADDGVAVGTVGDELCLNGTAGADGVGLALVGWDLDGDGTIDTAGEQGCFTCTEETEGSAVLFATDACGCTDTDRAAWRCVLCDPTPASQGYWHRQCLGLSAADGGIDPGRFGRGPKSPTEANFAGDLRACGDAALEDLGIYGTLTCDGLDADPSWDPCEKAVKQLTALALNVCSDRVRDACPVDVTPEGCTSADVGTLLEEVAGLIHAGECQTAIACADAVNSGFGLTAIGRPETEATDGTDPDADAGDTFRGLRESGAGTTRR